MIIGYPCAKLYCDTPTNSEDTQNWGRAASELTRVKKLSPVTINPSHIKGG